MNDSWIRGASLKDIMEIDTYAHLIQPADPLDPWNWERIQAIQLVAQWKFAVGHLHDALEYQAGIVPMLKKKFDELASQLEHKRAVYASVQVQSVQDAIRRLEAETKSDEKLRQWNFWKTDAEKRVTEARQRLQYITQTLNEYEQTGKLPEEKVHAHR